MRRVRDLSSAGFRIVLELEVRRVACRICGTVKRERLDFLADNAHFTKRFAFYVGRRCRHESIRDVAKEIKLDWETVKTLELQYMQAQLKRAGTPGPRAIGIDEISARKGHSYRIVVSDLVRKRPIWFGDADRYRVYLSRNLAIVVAGFVFLVRGQWQPLAVLTTVTVALPVFDATVLYNALGAAARLAAHLSTLVVIGLAAVLLWLRVRDVSS